MRNVVYGVGISLDGYIARRDHSVDFLFMPEDYSMAPFFESIDAVIMGRKTYEISLAMGGSYGLSMAAYVYSNSMPPEGHVGIAVMKGPVAPLIASLRSSPGKDIWLMGGGEMARQFLEEDLVDELHLGVVPVLIGDGIPAFPAGFPERKFELAENRSYSKGMVALKYRRMR